MNKRKFLVTTALGLASVPFQAARATTNSSPLSTRGPTLLTVSGAIERANRGALDPALDQMLHKHRVTFDRAYTFDFDTIRALPAVTIKPTLEYDAKPHALRGPLLTELLAAVGARTTAGSRMLLRAVDGYAVAISRSDARRYRFIVATHIDNEPLALGGLGPLWAVYDADRFADSATKPLNERFALCPWGLYHIEVQRER